MHILLKRRKFIIFAAYFILFWWEKSILLNFFLIYNQKFGWSSVRGGNKIFLLHSFRPQGGDHFLDGQGGEFPPLSPPCADLWLQCTESYREYSTFSVRKKVLSRTHAYTTHVRNLRLRGWEEKKGKTNRNPNSFFLFLFFSVSIRNVFYPLFSCLYKKAEPRISSSSIVLGLAENIGRNRNNKIEIIKNTYFVYLKKEVVL